MVRSYGRVLSAGLMNVKYGWRLGRTDGGRSTLFCAIMTKAGAELPEGRGTVWLRRYGAGMSGGGSTGDDL